MGGPCTAGYVLGVVPSFRRTSPGEVGIEVVPHWKIQDGLYLVLTPGAEPIPRTMLLDMQRR